MPLNIVPASEAFASLRSNRQSRWPDGRRPTEGRLGVHASVSNASTFTFGQEDSILTVGSCFAREIEKRLVSLGFNVPLTQVDIPREERASETANDILNKYVPPARLNELRWNFDPAWTFPDEAYLELEDGLWHDPHLAANLQPASLERVKERRRHVGEIYQAAQKARVVVITLGLVEAWFDRQIGVYLNDTPPAAAVKRHPDRFEFHLLSYEDVMESLEGIFATLKEFGHPDFRMILTVSPVPFKATFSGVDALQANTYSKSVLRAAAEAFSRRHSGIVDYFPSFEIVTLGDRMMSYHMDNIHVREEVVARIMGQVVKRYTGSDVPAAQPAATALAVEKPRDLNPVSLYEYAANLARVPDYLAAAQVMRNIADTYGDSRSGIPASDFRLNFGVWLLRAKQTVAGEKELQRAIELEPGNPRSHYKMGLALSRLKRSADAIDSFSKAIALAPSEAEYRWRIGEEYRRSKMIDLASASAQEALHLDPGHAGAKELLGKLHPSESEAAQA